jgi:hypothetical protein
MKLRNPFAKKSIHTSAPRDTSKSWAFFRLPAELRNKIYGELHSEIYYNLGIPKSQRSIFLAGARTEQSERLMKGHSSPSVEYGALAICQQFHEEFASIVYGETHFSGTNCTVTATFLEKIGPRNRARLKNLSMSISSSEVNAATDIVRLLGAEAVPMSSFECYFVGSMSPPSSSYLCQGCPECDPIYDFYMALRLLKTKFLKLHSKWDACRWTYRP